MSRKVLITGGEGQLGTSLQISLANNFNVLVTTRDPSDKNIVNHNVIKMNIIDQDNVFKVVGSFQPDIIINCAAFSDVDGNEIQEFSSEGYDFFWEYNENRNTVGEDAQPYKPTEEC